MGVTIDPFEVGRLFGIAGFQRRSFLLYSIRHCRTDSWRSTNIPDARRPQLNKGDFGVIVRTPVTLDQTLRSTAHVDRKDDEYRLGQRQVSKEFNIIRFWIEFKLDGRIPTVAGRGGVRNLLRL